MSEEQKRLESRLKMVILNTCNVIGCKECHLSWEEGNKQCCSALELQSQILDLELKQEAQ